jgi:predicted enzyme related to lactoylglutathione lyase
MASPRPGPPTTGHGKICYIEMPATDIGRSSEFYRSLFGWNVRTRGDGSVAFDDGVGEVSGTWLKGRPPAAVPGFVISIMVDDVAATVDMIRTAGCEIVRPIGADHPEITAWFRDRGGNVVGLYQERRPR